MVYLYNFVTDPDLGSKKKFVADPNLDRTLIRIRIQAKKDSVPGKS